MPAPQRATSDTSNPPAPAGKRGHPSGTGFASSLRAIATALMAGLVVVSGSACGKSASTIAIRNVTIVDCAVAAPRRNQTVLIRDTRIAAIGADISLPTNATLIDATDRFLIPGLWDMHVHLAGAAPRPEAAARMLALGITSVRDMGGHLSPLAALRESRSRGAGGGPRLFMAGQTLNGAQPAGFHRAVTSREDLVAAVAEQVAGGADFLKVHNQFPPTLFPHLAAEASRRELALIGHPPLGVSLAEASDAGMRSIEHIEVLTQTELHRAVDPPLGLRAAFEQLEGERGAAIFAAFVRNETAHTPTLSAYRAFVESHAEDSARQMGERIYDRFERLLVHLHSAGVTVLAGTDNAGPPGTGLHYELELLVSAGLTPLGALRAATCDPARVLGQEAELGTVEVGKLADLVLLEADPLADIRNTRRLSLVIQSGAIRRTAVPGPALPERSGTPDSRRQRLGARPS